MWMLQGYVSYLFLCYFLVYFEVDARSIHVLLALTFMCGGSAMFLMFSYLCSVLQGRIICSYYQANGCEADN